jgi:hypothetical protein
MCWHVWLSIAHFQHWQRERDAFLDHSLTVDEPWMHSFGLELKQQSAEWQCAISPWKKIAQHSQGTLKVMYVILEVDFGFYAM